MTSIPDLISRLRALDISLWSEEGRLCYAAPHGVLTPAHLAELRGHQQEILGAIRDGPTTAPTAIPPIVRVPRGGPFPLSYVQESFWMVEQFVPHTSFSNVFSAFLFEGTLDREALGGAFCELVQRHEALRTRFGVVDGLPIQIVSEPLDVDIAVEDLRGLASTEQHVTAARWVIQESNLPIDLSDGYPFRTRLLRMDDHRHILLLTVHHIVCDEWSSKLAFRELLQLYVARVSRRAVSLPELPVQLADFAVWQRRLVESGALAPQLRYWRQQLDDGDLPPLELPLDHPRLVKGDYRMARRPIALTTERTEALHALARQESCTVFMILVAALSLLLRRLTGADDVRLATQVATRKQDQVSGVVGPLFDTFIVRTDLSGRLTSRNAVRRVRDIVLHAYEHQDLPFEELLRAIERDRAIDRAGLARVLFLFGAVQPTCVTLPELAIHELDVAKAMLELDADVEIDSLTTFDLIVSLSTKARGVAGAFVYKTSLLSPNTVDGFVAQLDAIIDDFIDRPDEPLPTRVARKGDL